jgi:hypothetical protein
VGLIEEMRKMRRCKGYLASSMDEGQQKEWKSPQKGDDITG